MPTYTFSRAVAMTAVGTCAFAVAVGSGMALRAQQGPSARGNSGGIETLRVQDDVYMLAGAGANITVQVGPQGLVVVDTGTTALAYDVIAAIRQISPAPIRYVINTNVDPDHTGGNEKVVRAGEAIPGRNFAGEGAELIAQENALTRLSDAHLPIAAIPTSSYFVPQKDLYFNGQAVQIFHAPAAHTDGDSMVFFRKSDVLSVGDLFSTLTYPVIDASRGGSVSGTIAALNHILRLQVAGEKEEGGTMVVPGHGRVCDEADVTEYRDMVTIIRDRVQDLIKRGKTLDEVKAAGITADYDGVYGATTGAWTTEMFVEAVYRDLRQAPTNAKGNDLRKPVPGKGTKTSRD